MIDRTGRFDILTKDVRLTVHASLNWGRCWGSSADPSHVASIDSVTPFHVVSGDDTWGVWTRIIGPDDTPVQPGMLKFVMHHVIVVDVEEGQAITRLQFAFGDLDTYPTPGGAPVPGAGTGTGAYFDVIGRFEDATTYWLDVMAERADCGDEVWARCWVAGEDEAWVDFFFETCEYEE